MSVIPPLDRKQQVIRCQAPTVFIEGLPQPSATVLHWEAVAAPHFGHARVAMPAMSAPTQPDRLAEAARHLSLQWPDGQQDGQFLGIISSRQIEFTDRGQRLILEATSELAAALSVGLEDRWQVRQRQKVLIRDTESHFNAGPDSMASAAKFTIGGRDVRIFDSSPDARRWTVADAIDYLLALAGPSDAAAPSSQELQALAGQIDLGEANVTSLSLGHALVDLAGRAGLELLADPRGLGWSLASDDRRRRRSVRLAPAGSRVSAGTSNISRGRLLLSRTAAPNVLALGQRRQYESTFILQPGWDPALSGPRWRDTIRSESSDWPAHADVYRKWVLNEHGWYSDAPWQLSVHDFSSISNVDFPLQIPRRFLPCLSSDLCGQSLGVVVEVRTSSQGSWRPWGQSFWVSQGECAIYLGGDQLGADFFQACAAGQAQVRVTAAVAADARLSCRVEGQAGAATAVVDLSSHAAWRSVHSSSIFHSDPPGPAAERDDSELLGALARMHARKLAQASRGELTLGWIDASWRVGDVIDRIDGRSLELSSVSQSSPVVRSVRHDFGRAQSTTLTVSG